MTLPRQPVPAGWTWPVPLTWGLRGPISREEIPAAAAERVQHDLHICGMRLAEDARRAASGGRAGSGAVGRAAARSPRRFT